MEVKKVENISIQHNEKQHCILFQIEILPIDECLTKI